MQHGGHITKDLLGPRGVPGGGGGVPATILTLQPAAASGVDATIVDTIPNNNYGTATYMAVGKTGANTRRTLIKFDLTGIPVGSTVVSATLSLYLQSETSDNNRTVRVYRLKRVWVESEVTWNSYSTGNAWQTAGGFGVNDCEQTDIGSRAFLAAETVGEFKDFVLDVSAIQEIVSGTFTNNGFLIKADTENADYYTFSPSDVADANQHPKLVIVYTN